MSDQDDLKELAVKIRATPPEPANHRGSKLTLAEDCEVADISAPSSDNKGRQMSMWATNGKDFFPTEKTVKTLEPGQYIVEYSDGTGPYFTLQDINLDDLLVLPDSNSEKVLKHIDYFWSIEDKFRELGFLWKRGILLWGPPGSGKTSTVQQLSKQIVDLGGITIYCTSPHLTAQGLSVLRRIEKDRPIVVILEDMDAIVNRHGEADLLAMLDGEHQTDNVVFVATTNYPELLDKRFINRPSRFDEIMKIGMPSADAREFYLANKNPRLADNPEELAEWVDLTEGFSIAHLKEMIISIEGFGKTVRQAHARLQAMMDATPSDYQQTHDKMSGFGFTGQAKTVPGRGDDGGGSNGGY